MAVSTSSYFSNAIVGVPQIGADVNVLESHATPKFAIGTKFERQDGCVFRYSHFGAATTKARVVASNLNSAALIYSANAVIATSSAFQNAGEQPGVYPGMIGSRFVVLQIGTVAAGKFDGGYIGISSGTGLGQIYHIKRTYASNGTATTLELYEKIQVGLDATGDIVIAPAKYNNLEPAIAIQTDVSTAVGVSLATIATSSPWAWVQVRGRALVAQAAGATEGSWAVVSDSDTGYCEDAGIGIAASTTGNTLANLLKVRQKIGTFVMPTATSGNAIVDLAIE